MNEPPCPPGGKRAQTVVLVDDNLFDAHKNPFGPHPERPERLIAAREAVDAARALGVTTRALDARDATLDELARVHGASYIDEVDKVSGKVAQIDAETFLSEGSVAAARRAAGGALSIVDELLDGNAKRGLALVRPPGHHATPATGMGFCLFNNAAVAARHALSRGLQRVAIVDWDVHHGNGTQDAFYDDGQVLYISLHQYPLYPGTGDASELGKGDGIGTTANIPLSAGATDATYATAFHEVVEPLLASFSPELIIISAGFDAHERDGLAAMRVSEAGYRHMAQRLVAQAEQSAQGRVGVLLEGGYDLTGLRSSLQETLLAIAEVERDESEEDTARPAPVADADLDAGHRAEISRARRRIGEHHPGM